MNKLPSPIFKNQLGKIIWKKIYTREYGVQYSEMAILCLSDKAKYHIPNPSVNQIVIPDGNNSSFYIDSNSWDKLVKSLDEKYTASSKNLENYEKHFFLDAEAYLKTSDNINRLDLKNLSNGKLNKIYEDYQEKLFRYSVFAWTSFILNIFVAERATKILDKYLTTKELVEQKQEIVDSLFKPEKLAAVLKLQHDLRKPSKGLNTTQIKNLYLRYRWLSCLDIHNNPWTEKEFLTNIKSFPVISEKQTKPFNIYAKTLKTSPKDLEYLNIAKRFVYIKDVRDDYRRKGVFNALKLFDEIGKRLGILRKDVSFLQTKEISLLLNEKTKVDKRNISDRKNGFVIFLDTNKKLVCLTGKSCIHILRKVKLSAEDNLLKELKGTIASKGRAEGMAVIVNGIKDLSRVKEGNILIAVSTHPDYVPAMRKAMAIVTDEGGVTSHAAIVSREFGIPCIVGTKNATKLIKNGNYLIVDAINGVVNIKA